MSRFSFRIWYPTGNKASPVQAYMGIPNEISFGKTFILESEKNDEIIMMSTGLSDKNGEEIFEGDIVFNNWEIFEKQLAKKWQVKFGEHNIGEDYYPSPAYGWYLESKEEVSSIIQILDALEIIGNIYETPELLK